MSRFLRVFAVIFSLFFVGNAFAAGYTCSSYKKYTSCNAGYYLTGTAVGNSCAACPSGWTSAGGTTVGMAASCFKDITLNKNGFSTTIAAGAGTGCTVQANATGTNPATLRVYYNTACTLPTISSTTSGAYIYYNWSKNSANIAASSVTTIAATTTAPTDTYYIRKQACAANYYKNDSTTCTACPSTYPTSSGGTYGADRCFAACAAGTRKTTVSQVGCSTTAGGWMTAAHRVYNGNVSPEILAPYPYNTNTTTAQIYHTSALATTTASTPRQSFTGTMPAGHSVMGASGYITAYGARIINIDDGNFNEMQLIEFNVIPQGSTLTSSTSTAPYSGAYAPELSIIHGVEDQNFFEINATDGDYYTASAIPWMDSLEYVFGGAANIAFVQVTFANNDDGNAYEIQLDITGNGDWVSITGNQTTPTSTYTVDFGSNSGAWQTRILPAIAWVPCAAGKYRGGLNSNWYLITNQTACSNVTAGYWNNGGGTNATGGVISGKSGGTIAAGRWGAAGATTDQGSGAVNAGYYSTGGGTSATPTKAGTGCLSSKACGKVTAGCYTTSTGSTVACPNTCPGDMTSDAGSDAKTDCKITCEAGNYLAKSGDTCATCTTGHYCANDGTYYFNTSNDQGITAAADGKYVAGTGATTDVACAQGSYSEKSSASTKCIACSAGRTTSGTGTKYNATANNACSVTCSNAGGVYSWADPSWSANSVANLCTVSACNADTYYTEKTATGYKNTCTACGANSGNDANHTMSKCICDLGHTIDGKLGSSNTSTSGCTRISGIPCAVGQYLPAQATTCEDCDAGYYCPAEATSYSFQDYIQGRVECALGTYQPNKKQTSCLIADAGYYVPETAQTQQTACTGATYQPDTGKASCKTCPTATNNVNHATSYGYWNTGATGDHTTVTGCHVEYTDNTLDNGTAESQLYCYADTDAATTGEYGVDGTSKGCWVYYDKLQCNGGYYNKNYTEDGNYDFTYKTLSALQTGACTSVGSGYYSTDGTLTRTACATGLVTCGAGKCANEAADCGRKLHAGDQTIYLRSAARTSPALNVKIGNQTFFGALSTAYSSKLKVKKDNTTYSVVNDYQ